MEVDKRLIAVFHGDYAGITDSLVTCGKYDVVFHGHTHQKINEYHGKTTIVDSGIINERNL